MHEPRKTRLAARYLVRAYDKDWRELQEQEAPITAHCLFAALELWNLKHQAIARDGCLMKIPEEPAVLIEIEVQYVEI